ncbi:hypothetical protein [Pseudomonas sp. TH10]|uniref:hypothetical protein n=1 Tax=Pseudomonas sp. TH10 TaxID=2796376 RepID=UPI001F5B7A1F|nr:hypothetical protein [Pseudomonas sp. TH10]
MLPGVDAALHQLKAANDPGQQVVEVVGDAAGQLADCFHFLTLPKLGFCHGPLVLFGLKLRGALGDSVFQQIVPVAQR